MTIHQTGYNEYTLKVPNLPIPLPLDIITDRGMERIVLKDKTYKIKSSTAPVIDAKGNYLKNVVTD